MYVNVERFLKDVKDTMRNCRECNYRGNPPAACRVPLTSLAASLWSQGTWQVPVAYRNLVERLAVVADNEGRQTEIVELAHHMEKQAEELCAKVSDK